MIQNQINQKTKDLNSSYVSYMYDTLKMIKIIKPNGNGCHISVPKAWIGQPIEITTIHSNWEELTEQETFTRIPKKWGHTAHVYLPKRLNGKKVKIRRDGIKEEVIKRIIPFMKEIEGAYLIGSCARGEQTKNSDIDILVITNEIDTMIFDKKGQISFHSKKSLKNPHPNDVMFLANILSDAKPIINGDLLREIQRDFFKRLKDKKFRFNKEAMSLNKDTVHSLKIMRIFFEGYDKVEDKKKYVKEFKYPFEAKTIKEQAEQDSFEFVVSHLFFAVKNLFEKYIYIHNKKFSVKNITRFFKEIPKFKEYYNIFKTDRFKLYKQISIEDLRKIYGKCVKMKSEIIEVRRQYHG